MTYEARKILYETGAGFPQTMMVGWDETAAMPYALKVDQFGRLSSDNYIWDAGGMQWVPAEVSGLGVTVVGPKDSAENRIDPAKDQTVAALNGFSIPAYDYISLGYGGGNLTSVVYKLGGSGGTTVATLTLGYTGSDLTSVTRS